MYHESKNVIICAACAGCSGVDPNFVYRPLLPRYYGLFICSVETLVSAVLMYGSLNALIHHSQTHNHAQQLIQLFVLYCSLRGKRTRNLAQILIFGFIKKAHKRSNVCGIISTETLSTSTYKLPNGVLFYGGITISTTLNKLFRNRIPRLVITK